MNLGDVLKDLGHAPLKAHTWTDAIVTTLTAILPSSTPIHADSTGDDVLAAMRSLPQDEREKLLMSQVDLLKGTLTLTDTQNASPKQTSTTEGFRQAVLKDLVNKPRSALILLLGTTITIAAVITVIVMTWSYAHSGKTPNTDLFQTLIKALVDVFNASVNN